MSRQIGRTDDAGRMTYGYDEADRLLTENAAGALTTYSWDEAGNNTLMQSAGGTTTMTWDAENRLRTIQVPGGSVVTNTYGADGPTVSMRRGGASWFLHPDHLGSIWTITDTTGGSNDSYTYDVFGVQLSTWGAGSVNPFRYIGQQGYYAEPNLGLNYVRARWHRPTTGSWLSVDPVEGEPRYGYVGGGPMVATDGGGKAARHLLPGDGPACRGGV